MLFALLGVLVVLLITGAVIDFKARRRRRYCGIDGAAVRDRRNGVDATEAQMRSRIANQGDNGPFFGGGF